MYQPGRRAAGTTTAKTCAEDVAGFRADETICLEHAERGGAALLLPGALRRFVALLRCTQPAGFEVTAHGLVKRSARIDSFW